MTDIHLMAVLDSLKNIFHKGGGGVGLQLFSLCLQKFCK